MPAPEKPRRHLNADQRRALKAAKVAEFLKASGRKAQKGVEPNDRGRIDHVLQNKLKRMPPDEVDRLMREDEDSD